MLQRVTPVASRVSGALEGVLVAARNTLTVQSLTPSICHPGIFVQGVSESIRSRCVRVSHKEEERRMGRYRNVIPIFAVAFGCYVRGAGAEYDSCNNGTAVVDIGNGRCDGALNTAVCGFDGGDVSFLDRRLGLWY